MTKIEPVYWRVHADNKLVGWRAYHEGRLIQKPTKREVEEEIKKNGGDLGSTGVTSQSVASRSCQP